MQVLVVEDEASLARVLSLELAHAGMAVETTGRGRDAVDRVRRGGLDCVLLDVMLPDLSGIEVLRRIREASDVAVIMVTARGQTPDIVAALDIGADDYLVKPVRIEELAARIRAVVRRRVGLSARGRVLAAADVVLFRDQHRVEAAGRPVELAPLEFRLLEFLLLHRDWVQSRDTLLDRVWGFEPATGGNLVEVTVSRLRRRLAEAGSRLRIETVRGVGYVVRSDPASDRP